MVKHSQLPLQLLDPAKLTPEDLIREISMLPEASLIPGAAANVRGAEFRLIGQIKAICRSKNIKAGCFKKNNQFGILIRDDKRGELELSGSIVNQQGTGINLIVRKVQVKEIPETVKDLLTILCD